MGTYLKLALRILRREKLYALINIAGLAMAIGCCLVLGLYLRSELTYDQHHVNHERIYRLANAVNIGGTEERIAQSSTVIGQMLTEGYPQIVDFVRFINVTQNNSFLIRHEDDEFYWDKVFFADPNVFDVFTHEIIYGDPETALDEPSTIAISETFARRYFGDENPIGETLGNESNNPATVTLVFADLPENSHLRYDALYSTNQTFLRTPDNTTQRRQALWSVGVYTYLVVEEGFDPADFNAIGTEFYETNMAAIGNAIGGTWETWLEPLAGIHLNSNLDYDEPTGNRYYLYGFAAVGIFILIIACINYVNLATARATRRARSVGIRKILGSSRSALVAQFLGEAVLFSLLAALVGIALVEIVTTFSSIETLLGSSIEVDVPGDPMLLAATLGLSVLIGLLAGIYPSVYLSSWAPLSALVGENRASRGNVRFRQILVFAQFAISIGVISCTLLMFSQMQYLQNIGLGFEEENRVVITMRGTGLLEKEQTIINELTTHAGVLGATTSSSVMGQNFPLPAMNIENNTGTMQQITGSLLQTRANFFDVMGMQLIDGRDFSTRLLTDVGTTFLVNRSLVERMGWDNPIGKRIQINALPTPGRVIGVVENFNYQSLHNSVDPLVIMPLTNDFANISEEQQPFATRWLTVNVAGDGINNTLRHIEDTFAELDPTHPFEFAFLDDRLDDLYDSEQKLMELIGIFAAICIFIACLGLYGLASFTTEQRTKEIGIRKVLGATTAQIIMLLSRNILIIVLVSAIVASIGAWLAIDEWLAGFAYRTPINPLYFIVAMFVAVGVAFLTIALQSYRTARGDPVNALRYE